MDKAKILRLCNDIEDAVNELAKCCEIIDLHTHTMLISKLRKIGTEISEPNHAYWIPTECGVKCSECGTEYADTDYPEKMYQCPHCYSQMGEPRKLTNGDKIRAMTDEELAAFMVTQAIMGAMNVNGITEDEARKATIEIMKSGKPNDDIAEAIEWLRQEVSEDAGTDD